MDRTIEPLAMKYVRAKLAVEEAEGLLEIAKLDLMKVLAPGEKYVTKDGETITHTKGSVRSAYVAEKLKKLLTPAIWKSVRIDAVDKKKLDALIDAGIVQRDMIIEGIEETPVRSSLRVTWPSLRTTTRVPTKSK